MTARACALCGSHDRVRVVVVEGYPTPLCAPHAATLTVLPHGHGSARAGRVAP